VNDPGRAFGDRIDQQFQDYADKINSAYGEWAGACEEWQKQRPGRSADGPPRPDTAVQHNLEALGRLRRQAEDVKVNSPLVPAQPAIVDAEPGHITSRPGHHLGLGLSTSG
jgi:hypothetical protein